MNRFKLLLLLLIVLAFGVLCFQNRQPLSLKLLCPDPASSCWYQTPSLPLALWIAVFVVLGIFSGLLWHWLNGFAYASRRKGSTPSISSEEPVSRRDFPTTVNSSDEGLGSTATSYEVESEPETVRRSGSTYSYKFKDKSDRSNESGEPKDSQKEDEEWL